MGCVTAAQYCTSWYRLDVVPQADQSDLALCVPTEKITIIIQHFVGEVVLYLAFLNSHAGDNGNDEHSVEWLLIFMQLSKWKVSTS